MPARGTAVVSVNVGPPRPWLERSPCFPRLRKRKRRRSINRTKKTLHTEKRREEGIIGAAGTADRAPTAPAQALKPSAAEKRKNGKKREKEGERSLAETVRGALRQKNTETLEGAKDSLQREKECRGRRRNIRN